MADFPSVDEVLNKLKSNGTFDSFRKTCLASVQAEPSFRAYGEHIEVVARRYLQNFKWRDTTTKNQVRSRLKDHALGVIESPDIQVGVPFSLLVEKAMETKGKELLPKIMEVVDTLRLAKPIHVQVSEPSTNIKCQENNLHKSGLDFDLSLPIDLPGLVSSGSKRDSVRDSVESANKSVKSKQKLVDSNMKGGGMKVKLHVSDGNTLVESLKDVKTKEKDREGSQKLVPLGDGKKDGKVKVMKPKKVKEELWEKDSQDKQKDIGVPCVEGTSGKSEKEKIIKEASDKKVKQGDGVSDRKGKFEEMSERKERSVERTSDRKLIAKENKSEENSRDDYSPENSSSRSARNNDDDKKMSEQEKKLLPLRRRSARLASFTEEQKKDEPSDVDELEEEADGQQLSESESEARASKTRGNRKRKPHIAGPPSQKRAKAYLDSSSEDSGEEIYCFTKRLEASEELRQDIKRSIRRKHPYKPDQETAMDISTKRKRLSRTASPASTCSNSSTLMVDGQGVHYSILEQTKTRKRKNKCTHRFSELSRGTSKSPVKSPSPPVVVTRSNLHVKPNRRYYDNMSEEEMECEVDDSSGQSDIEGNTQKHSRY